MAEQIDLHFKTNVQLKSIIGKDLINDDNIAILELVKNSFDADAKQVKVKYFNLKENDDKNIDYFSSSTSRLVIQDDGIGMNINDIRDKWLNIAYSEKKTNKTQHKRRMAGAKGVGRFSCDRLGEYLNLYAKTNKDSNYYKLSIDWKKFEIEDEDKEIQSIPLKYEVLSPSDFKTLGFENFENGVLLEIIKLRSIWAYPLKDKNGNTIDWDVSKFIELKKYLEKLINPNQAFESNDFGVFIDSPEFKEENDSLDSYLKFIGPIQNRIFEELDFKTTSVEVKTINNGSEILTTLKDKGDIVFWIREKNNFYPFVKNAKSTVYYLSTYAKSFFTKQTGIRSVDYGSIFLFINGFRIPPYGDVENDWLGIDHRKAQGHSRNIGLREIVGQIEILDESNDFQIISSREGIVRNENFKHLVQSSNNNSFFFKSFRRLERYVVEGLNWDSSIYDNKDTDESKTLKEIEAKILSGNISEDELIFREDEKTKQNRVYSTIHNIISARPAEVIELYINENLIIQKIEEEREVSEREFNQLIEDFSNKKIDADTLNKILHKKAQENVELEKQLKEFSKYTTNEATSKAILELQVYKDTINKQTKIIEDLINQLNKLNKEKEISQKELEILKKDVEKAIDVANDEKEKRVKAEEANEKVNAEKKILEKELSIEQKKGVFKGALIGTDKERIVGLQHQIYHSSSRIERNVKLLIEHLKKINLDEKTKKHISIISLEAAKINSIANFITKSNFNLKATEIKTDFLNFIKEYIDEIYTNESSIIDSKIDEFIIDFPNDINYVIDLKPLEISTLIDNLINNSEKANATKIILKAFIKDNKLNFSFEDNGIGINPSIIEKAFDFGETTTNGSGIGLFQVFEIVKNLKGEVYIDKEFKNGTKIIIKL